MDRKARRAIAVFQCNSAAGHADEDRDYGTLDRANDLVTCLSEAGAPMGVAFELGPPGMRVRRARVVDLQSGQRVTTPIDTTRLAQEIIAMIAASRQAKAVDLPGRERIPLVLRGAGDTIEVWYIPTTQVPAGQSWMAKSLGGERSVVVTPDGRSMVCVSDETSSWRPFTPDTVGLVVIRSLSDEVPTLTEMMASLQVAREGRGVAIETRRWTYVRLGEGWVVSKR